MVSKATTTPEFSNDWRRGWYTPATPFDSPHCDERPLGAEIDLVVVHSISLPPGKYGGNGVNDLFLGTLDCNLHPYYEQLHGLRVSAHFFIQRNGELQQFVSCDQRAWHAGKSSYRGRPQCNDDSIGIELEGLEGLTFEHAQYEALTQLCRALAAKYPIAHIVGHEHIAPGRKADPGPGFDWARFQDRLSMPAVAFPGAGAVSCKS